GYGIPSVHVDNAHVREGIGEASVLVPPVDTGATERALVSIESNYEKASRRARARAEEIADRQAEELDRWVAFVEKAGQEKLLKAPRLRPGGSYTVTPGVWR